MFQIWLGALFTQYVLQGLAETAVNLSPFSPCPFSFSHSALSCPTPFFLSSIVFHSFPSISHGPYPIPSIFLCPILFLLFSVSPPFSFVLSCSFYFSVSHYVPSISHYSILFLRFPFVPLCSFYFPLFLPFSIVSFCSFLLSLPVHLVLFCLLVP